ncbi:MAG: hypothetical protein R3F39_22370 [Myxococcota bacterium]
MRQPLCFELASRALVVGLTLFAAGFSLSACDLFGGDDGTSGPATTCSYPTSEGTSGKEIGASCTTNAECATNFCMMPGATGNLSNEVFGFCSRACDCNDDASTRVATEDANIYECVYPAGNQGKNRHVVLECTNVADCRDVDPAWSECFNGSSLVGIGTIKKICASFK